MRKNTPPEPPNGHYRVPPSDQSKRQKNTPKTKGGYAKVALLTGAGIAIGFMFGLGANAPDDDNPSMDVTEVHEAEASTTAQDEPQPTETETVEVEVEVTPEGCQVALTHADDAIDLYSLALTTAADGLTAYSAGDYATLDQSTAEIEAMTGELTDTLTSYYINSSECRGS